MKVLVTGGAGYVGSVLTGRLLKQGHYVKVLDNLMFGQESLLGVYNEPNFEFIKGDIRDKKLVRNALHNMDGVIHLAALVGHPLCYAQPKRTEEINYEATRFLLKEAVACGVKRFIFASTCSNYGISDSDILADEDAALRPMSIYAKTKVGAEQYILSFPKKENFIACILRLATVFGVSSRMRFDLLVNELVKDAMTKKKLIIKNPSAWRPLLHIQDAAGAFISCLEAKTRDISGAVFNVGCGNYQKKEIARIVKKQIPTASVGILKEDTDSRDYKVSFEKISKTIGFKTKLTLEQGIREIKEVIQKGIVITPQSPKYTNQWPKDE
jgi:nucleoside-diphosphate-sugar epimerase